MLDLPDNAATNIGAIYVEAGAILKLSGDPYEALVFAEDGAILDITQLEELESGYVYYSAGTKILGRPAASASPTIWTWWKICRDCADPGELWLADTG